MNRSGCGASGAGRVLPCVASVLLGFAAVGVVLLLAAAPVRADLGPKPSMEFSFEYEGEPLAVEGGHLIECEDRECQDGEPLEVWGPQGFSCTADMCSSMAYGYKPYHRLVITFTDRTRESNVFAKKAFDAKFKVMVSDSAMEVTESGGVARTVTGSRCCSGLWLTLLLETLVAGVYVSAFHLPKATLGWVPLASAFTLPVVWFVFPQLGFADGWAMGLSEGFAVAFEAGLIYLVSRGTMPLKHVALLSVAMNAASFLAGLAF